MKRYILVFLLFAGCSVLSVRAENPLRFGVVGGLNLSYNSGYGADNIAGYHIGGKVEYSFLNRLYVESGLLFTRKGFKFNDFYYTNPNGGLSRMKTFEKNYYLELPIHLGCKMNINRGISFFVSGGGYLGVGLFGKYKEESPDGNHSSDLYKSGDGYRRFDCGVGLKAGVEIYKRVQLSVSYDWGLVDVVKNADSNKNRNAMFSCGYMF